MRIPREYVPRLRQLLRRFPIVTILGPRQCGKTTFIRSQLPDWQYLDLEKPSQAARLSDDPERALERLGRKYILDESQQIPALFPALRSRIDEHRNVNGQAVLLGSASPVLIRRISESLAGRTGFLEMSPLQWSEVRSVRKTSADDLWLRGGFPDAFLAPSAQARLDWFEGYTRTFIERDLRNLGIEFSPAQMRKIWAMLAHVHGGLWNASKLAAALGVNYHTINRYTDILEQTFLIRRLPPYYANIGKRLVKSPKLYFRDTGLLHYFLGIHDSAQLEVHPARGGSWEGFIVSEICNRFALYRPDVRPYFWRTATGHEIDLVLDAGSRLLLFEIKLNSAPRLADVENLSAGMKDLKQAQGFVVYPGNEDYPLGQGITVLSAAKWLAGDRILELL